MEVVDEIPVRAPDAREVHLAAGRARRGGGLLAGDGRDRAGGKSAGGDRGEQQRRATCIGMFLPLGERWRSDAFCSTRLTISLNSSAVRRSFFSNDFAFTCCSIAIRSSSVALMPSFSHHSSIDGGPLFLPSTMFTGFWPTSSGVNGTYSSGCSLRAMRTQPAMMPDSTS